MTADTLRKHAKQDQAEAALRELIMVYVADGLRPEIERFYKAARIGRATAVIHDPGPPGAEPATASPRVANLLTLAANVALSRALLSIEDLYDQETA